MGMMGTSSTRSFHASHSIRLSYSEPCGSSTSIPHLLLCHCLMSCLTKHSVSFDLPTSVLPQIYKCLFRSVRGKPRVAFLPASWPRMRSLPGGERIAMRVYGGGHRMSKLYLQAVEYEPTFGVMRGCGWS